MFLDAKSLLEKRAIVLRTYREPLTTRPGLALIWVGNDAQTATFVRLKKAKAQELDCEFWLHHFERADERQLSALIAGLNQRKDVQGIVLQLPLPVELDADELIAKLTPEKDIDGLTSDSPFTPPTPAGIVELLEHNHINPADHRTVIIGAGRLVGAPLARIFRERGWPFTQINQRAEQRAEEIRQHDIVIACTGHKHLITPAMVSDQTILVDGSGVDVDVKTLEPLVAQLTPAKGAVGPLTISWLFENLLMATKQSSKR